MESWLERNLQVLRGRWPEAAECIASAEPADLNFADTREPGVPTASLTTHGRTISLASRYQPTAEAEQFAAAADLNEHAVLVVLGFAMGYHLRSLLRKSEEKAVVAVYEPSASRLRSVLEHADYRDVLGHESLALLVGEIGKAEMARDLERSAGLMAQGTQILTHPAVRQADGALCKAFLESFREFVAYCRTSVTTALSHAALTCRNLSHNLWRYAAGSTVNELADACRGRPAVLVSAGPSLAKNVHLLSQPGVRDRVVIIVVQTALKPLLQRGIEPHFVTALDYHEISRRFYEGVPDLPNTTLVAEPKANEHILRSYPGPIRVLHNSFLDRILGPQARPIRPMPSGATVAHLSLYLAQLLGCDPIILIGQDLGFSDGLYYCPGTAIHEVWEPELGVFNTLEMMEWKRIARHKLHLQRLKDVHDQPIFTDNQMYSYLNQFERDFLAASQRIIDATEGGLPKQHTERMTLAEALEQFATEPLPKLPEAMRFVPRQPLRGLRKLIAQRIDQVREVRRISQETQPMLQRMLEVQRDKQAMERLFAQVDREKAKMESLGDVFAIVNQLNQIGAFRRVKADRAIRVSEQADPFERQRRQLQRDLDNIAWLIEACDETQRILDEALQRTEEAIQHETWTREGEA